jgi:hypothetical protein
MGTMGARTWQTQVFDERRGSVGGAMRANLPIDC